MRLSYVCFAHVTLKVTQLYHKSITLAMRFTLFSQKNYLYFFKIKIFIFEKVARETRIKKVQKRPFFIRVLPFIEQKKGILFAEIPKYIFCFYLKYKQS